MRRSAKGRSYTIAWVPVQVPAGRTVPLVVLLDDGQILHEAWKFHTSRAYRSKSASSLEKSARCLGMLYDYFRANRDAPLTAASAEDFRDDFMSAVDAGTIQPDGTDPTGLHWSPASAAQFSLVRSEVREFCKFCDDLHGPQNALSSGRFLGAIEAAHAREVRKRFSKLYHLSARGEKRPPRADGVGAYGQDPRVRPAKSFPRSLLSAFIFDGCRRERTSKDFSHPLANEFNIPLMLALVLLAGGGIRKSELFHMFADDIRAEEVRLYHPETGQYAWKGPAGGRLTGERKTFLAKVHQRRPRNRYPKGHSQFAGWKEMLLDYGSPNNYSVVQWIAPQLRELFVLLHGVYVRHVRPKGLDHPYYFVSLSQGEFGEPWTVGGFNAAFATAMRKIGEAPDSDRGRNPHGLRHLYGQTLTDLGLSPRVIQHAMHHRSILSQLAYTKPSPQRASEALEAARRFNAPGHSVGLEPSMLQNYQWRSDPLGIFAPWNLGGR